MEEQQILEQLLELAREAGLRVRVAGRGALGAGELPLSSGVCRVRGEVWVVLSGAEPPAVQIGTLCGALGTHAAEYLETVHLPPALRERLEAAGAARRPGGGDESASG